MPLVGPHIVDALSFGRLVCRRFALTACLLLGGLLPVRSTAESYLVVVANRSSRAPRDPPAMFVRSATCREGHHGQAHRPPGAICHPQHPACQKWLHLPPERRRYAPMRTHALLQPVTIYVRFKCECEPSAQNEPLRLIVMSWLLPQICALNDAGQQLKCRLPKRASLSNRIRNASAALPLPNDQWVLVNDGR